MDTELVHHVVCLFTSQLSLVLIAPTHVGMARPDLGGWLHTKMVYPCADGNPSKYKPGLALINFVDVTNDVF